MWSIKEIISTVRGYSHPYKQIATPHSSNGFQAVQMLGFLTSHLCITSEFWWFQDMQFLSSCIKVTRRTFISSWIWNWKSGRRFQAFHSKILIFDVLCDYLSFLRLGSESQMLSLKNSNLIVFSNKIPSLPNKLQDSSKYRIF